MASPYTSVAVTGYNPNPPADDGSAVAANRVLWSTIKTKLPDPLKTAIEAINANLVTAFGKTVGGAGITSTAVDYTVASTDQGKLVRATAASITVTTPDATDVTSPFVFAFLNNSSGTLTFDGNGSQTVDGNASVTVPAGAGFMCYTDGTNWFTTGQQGTLVGKQLMYGDIINGTIVESNATNAATFAIKTLAGTDPSASDPVLVCFRNATVGTGTYVYRNITAATSLVLSSGSTLGAANGIPFKAWLVLFDDAGTIRLGAINCLSGKSVYRLGQFPIASAVSEGGAGAADSAHVFYANATVTSKPYLPFAVASYESGLSAAGSWNASPTRLQLYGHGLPLPGTEIQIQQNITSAVATGMTTLPHDDSIPQYNEGDTYLTQAITPSSAANLFEIEWKGSWASTAAAFIVSALFQDAAIGAPNALAAVATQCVANNKIVAPSGSRWVQLAGVAGGTATTFTVRAGGESAGTTTFNGESGARLLGGVMASFLTIKEIMT